MARSRAERAAARKVRDRWRAKNWYTIVTPQMFAFKHIAETPADDPSKLLGRVAEVTLYELTGNFKKMHVKLYFQIAKVQGSMALTKFIGHETTSDYIRRMVRRRRTRIDAIFPVDTVDGYRVQVNVIAIADRRIKSSLKSAVRKAIVDHVVKKGSDMRFSEFVKYMLSDEGPAELSRTVKPVYPVIRIDIHKSEVLREPTDVVIELPEEEKEEAEEAAAEVEEATS